MKAEEGTCELCGHYVSIRQKAHIISEGKNNKPNILMLCPSCHVIFDTELKPKLYKALRNAGTKNLPVSWKESIYKQAAKRSGEIMRRKKAVKKRKK